jgi:hypothetical protein
MRGGVVRYLARWDLAAAHPQFSDGIWDSVTEEWVVRGLATAVASWHAAVLSLRYEGEAERPNGRARYMDPPTRVELHITVKRTEAALLHMWAREADGWHGYVTYLDRDPRDGGRWANASALRPLDEDEGSQTHTSELGRSGR